MIKTFIFAFFGVVILTSPTGATARYVSCERSGVLCVEADFPISLQDDPQQPSKFLSATKDGEVIFYVAVGRKEVVPWCRSCHFKDVSKRIQVLLENGKTDQMLIGPVAENRCLDNPPACLDSRYFKFQFSGGEIGEIKHLGKMRFFFDRHKVPGRQGRIEYTVEN